MLTNVLRKYFNNDCISSTNEYELYYQQIHQKNVFLSHRIDLNGLIILKTKEINFHKIADELRKSISNNKTEEIDKINCKWIICSESGGIYLYV